MSAFRDGVVCCPRCTDESLNVLEHRGGRWVCRGCHGMLVPHAMFDDLVEDMNRTRDASNLFDPNRPNRRKLVGPAPATALAPGTLPCPQCGHLMGRHVFAGQELDRCATHGVWCDRDELAAVLERTAGVPEQWGFWRRFLDSLAGF